MPEFKKTTGISRRANPARAPARERLVVIGNGMAGMRSVEELLARSPDRYDITVIGAEPHPNYNRILLSSVLAGDKRIADIVINPLGWYDERKIRLGAGKPAAATAPAPETGAAAGGGGGGDDK